MKDKNGFDKFQRYQIKKGKKDKINTSIYSNIEYSWDQMEQMRLAILSGIDVSTWSSSLSSSDMEKLRIGEVLFYPDKDVVKTEDHKEVKDTSSESEINIINLVNSDLILHPIYSELDKVKFYCEQEIIFNSRHRHPIIYEDSKTAGLSQISSEFGYAWGIDPIIKNHDNIETENKKDTFIIENEEEIKCDSNIMHNIENLRIEKTLSDQIRNDSSNTKRQRVKFKYVLLFIALLLSVGVYLFRDLINLYFEDININLSTNEVSLEMNEPFIASKYLESYTEGTDIILPELDTSKLGAYAVKYIATNSKKNVLVTLIVNVVDTNGPVITLTEDKVELDKNKDIFDCRLYIKDAIDEVDGNLMDQVVCMNSLDLSKDVQTVNYTVSDFSGNEGRATIVVVFKKSSATTINKDLTTKPNATPTPWIDPNPSQQSGGGWTEVYEESWSTGGSYEVDSDVTVGYE